MSTPSLGTPLLLITNAGLAAASVAMPQGPYIHITSFQIGSAYGYEPQPTDTGLNGNLLFTGTPTTYEYIGNNTLNIICEIPPDAGPFQFGEVGLFLDGGVLFAKGVFAEPQTKYSSLGTNVVSSYTFNCLLKLQQSVAVFQIDTLTGPPAVADIFQWSDVFPPGVSANPDVPLYLIRELDAVGDSTLLQNTSDSDWTVGTTYNSYFNKSTGQPGFTVANSSTTWVQISAAQCHPADLGVGNRVMLLKTPDGFFRSVSSVVVSGSNYQFNLNTTNDGTYSNTPLLNAPAEGSTVELFRDDVSSGRIYYSQIIDPPSIPLASSGVPGLAYGGTGTYMPGGGVIEAFGLLQAPSTNTGRALTAADDLNNFGLFSGLYVASGAGGFPANLPVSYSCMVWVHNIGNGVSSQNGSDVTQIAYPMNDGGGAVGTGIGGFPPYWRQGYNGSTWTNWEPFLVSNKQGGSGAITVTPDFSHQGVAMNTPITPNAGQAGMIVALFSTDGNGGAHQSLIVGGNVVGQASKGGGAGFGRLPELTASFSAGQTIEATNTAGGTVNFYLYYYNT